MVVVVVITMSKNKETHLFEFSSFKFYNRSKKASKNNVIIFSQEIPQVKFFRILTFADSPLVNSFPAE